MLWAGQGAAPTARGDYGAEHQYQVYLVCGQVLLAAGELTQAREIVGEAHVRLVSPVEKLPIPAEGERLGPVPQHAVQRRLRTEPDEHHGQ